MHARTEEFLYLLLWGAEQFLHPTWRNLDESFEGWAHRRGFLRRIHQLEERRFLERKPSGANERIFRLTEQGRLAALGGRDPVEFWQRPWDGAWRFFFFDITRDDAARVKLRRVLRSEGFGCLQGSVWISPHPFSKRLLDLCVEAKGISAVSGSPEAPTSDQALVQGAWDFERINAEWQEEMRLLEACPQSGGIEALKAWAAEEHPQWKKALAADPLLPEALWPQGYLGRKAWQKRCRISARAAGALGRG